jgi:hypothetical protein
MTHDERVLASAPLAAAIIISFTILGFLFGYLVMRLYLAGAFGRADVATNPDQDKVERADASSPALRAERPMSESQPQSSAQETDATAAALRLLETSAATMPVRQLAKTLLVAERYEEAAQAYAAVAKTSDDPLVQYEYAVALSQAEDDRSPKVRDALLRARDHADQLSPAKREELYVWLTFVMLYEDYRKAREIGEEALVKGVDSGALYVNLACAFAQAYRAETDPKQKEALRKRVLEFIGKAVQRGDWYRTRLVELMRPAPADQPNADDDLAVFAKDADVRKAVGLDGGGA